MSPQLRFGGRSDVGMQRHNNQDSMYAGPHLIAVADGVGGAAGGEIASRLTINAFAALDTMAVNDPQQALLAAINSADVSIRNGIAQDPALAGMSTTLTAILATDTQIAIGHIGDSRAYLLRAGVLSQLTTDHTLVQSLIDSGQITEAEARTHPQRSWIMRAVDGRGRPELDSWALEVEPGDRYLLCSDGLSSYVDKSDILAALANPDLQRAADNLVDLALQAGGPDNITCIVAEPVDSAQPAPGAEASAAVIYGGAIAEARAQADAASATTMPDQGGDEFDGEDPPIASTRRRSIGRRLTALIAVIVILIAAAVGGIAVYVHHQYYVAASDGDVAIYQGVHGNAAGIKLSHLHTVTNLPVTALPQDDQDRVANRIETSGGPSGASDVVANLRAEACAMTTPTPSSAPATTPQKTPSRHPHPTATPLPTPSPTPSWCGP